MRIEFHRRSLALFYYVLAIVFVVFGILFLMVGLGTGIGEGKWSSKIADVVEWSLGGVVWICGAPAMWLQGRKYRHNLVRLTGDAIFIHSVGGKEFTIPYAVIRSVDFDPALRKRLMTIHTPETTYTFDGVAIPRIAKVVDLLRARAVKP